MEKAVRLAYQRVGYDNDRPTILIGRVKAEMPDFLIFETARNDYTIAKAIILWIEPTKKNFYREELNEA